MRYLAIILLMIIGLSFFSFVGCGKSPEGDVNYNELRNTPPPEKHEPGSDAKKAPG
jgi:hypothetical protein